MIDLELIANNFEVVNAKLAQRGDYTELLTNIKSLLNERKTVINSLNQMQSERNIQSKKIGELLKNNLQEESLSFKQLVSELNLKISDLNDKLKIIEASKNQLALSLPNIPDDLVPEKNTIIKTWGIPQCQPGQGLSHVDIGTKLGILDLDRAAKLSGTRFWILKNAGAKLERALINFFLDLHSNAGYSELMVPYLVHREIAEGTAQLPKFEKDMFKLSEPVNGADMFLIPTAEVPITNLHRNEILDASLLPLKYVGFTPCFRSEVGNAGRDVRGIIRTHQFHKVELVWICTSNQAEKALATLVQDAETCLQLLELPYQIVELCAEDMGFGAKRCFDLEVFLPSQGYREISSCSWFGDFQSRRMQMKFRNVSKNGEKGKVEFVHTLNGSGLAVGRTLVAILENNVQSDGSVIIPKVLRQYLGGLEVIKP